MSRNVVIGTAIVIVILVLGWYYLGSQKGGVSYSPPQATPAPQVTQPATSPATSSAASQTAEKNVVTITSSGFSPQNITIKAGETVTWMNEDTVDHTVNSAVHPTHQLYPPLNLGVIKPGGKSALAFPKAGAYKYHDHLNPSHTGTITVQ